jgi:hypothetical protein
MVYHTSADAAKIVRKFHNVNRLELFLLHPALIKKLFTVKSNKVNDVLLFHGLHV